MSLPLSLYVHMPWCVKKCPYCDFNSYAKDNLLPEQEYIQALITDLEHSQALIQERSIKSIFFGGGTPSLFSPKSFADLLQYFDKTLKLDSDVEITMEANPGTTETYPFEDYAKTGINRVSLGIQSFSDKHLQALGRIHSTEESKKAIDRVIKATFRSFNLDLMYGLPDQSVNEALDDLHTALSFSPPHLSWYNLTIEPNTLFHHTKPPLPPENTIIEMETTGQQFLQDHGLKQYEVSAYAKKQHRCEHNLNYWEFGDYLGIGAGAHSKITQGNTITRFSKARYPKTYLLEPKKICQHNIIAESDRPFEFMLNALRLTDGVPATYFDSRSLCSLSSIQPMLMEASKQDLLQIDGARLCPTPLGKRFLNDLIWLFHPKNA